MKQLDKLAVILFFSAGFGMAHATEYIMSPPCFSGWMSKPATVCLANTTTSNVATLRGSNFSIDNTLGTAPTCKQVSGCWMSIGAQVTVYSPAMNVELGSPSKIIACKAITLPSFSPENNKLLYTVHGTPGVTSGTQVPTCDITAQ